MKYAVVSSLFISLFSYNTIAKENHQHKPHAHGLGQMNIAVEGNELLIELINPGYNIVGFEHQPNTAEQKASIESAASALKQPQNLFIINEEANCKIEHSQVSSALMSSEKESHDKDHEHKEENSHKEEHEHDYKEAHDHEHNGSEETHAEFESSYTFHCDNPEKIMQIDVALFNVFPQTEKLNASVISASKQTSKQLTKEDTIIDL